MLTTCLETAGDAKAKGHTLDMPLRPRPVIHPLRFQSRTLAVTAAAEAKQNQEKAADLEKQVETLESDPFFVTIDGGGPVLEDTDIFDGGSIDA